MDSMSVYLRSIDPKTPLLSAAEWDAITLVTEWLKPFRDATTRMSAARSPTLSTVYVVFRQLEDSILSILSTLPEGTPVELRRGLLNAHRKLSDYYRKFDKSPFYTWATCKLSNIACCRLRTDMRTQCLTLAFRLMG